MSIVSNTINALPGNFGAITKSNGNLGDNTFSNLLEKQMASSNEAQNNLFGQIGEIAQFAGIEGIDLQDLITSSKQQIKQTISDIDLNNDGEIGSSEMVAFLSRPFDSHSSHDGNHGLMNFAKRQAAGFYSKCASNVVTDLTEFVQDALSLS